MPENTDTGTKVAWWEKFLATPTAGRIVDGIIGAPASQQQPVEATPPEPTIQDSEPYFQRVLNNETSRKILLGTGIVVAVLGLMAYARRR